MTHVLEILSELKNNGISLSLDVKTNNLKLRGDLSLLTSTQKENIRANKQDLVLFLKGNSVKANVQIPSSNLDSVPFALAPNQKGIWFHEKVEDLGTAYIIPAIYFYDLNDFNQRAFLEALQSIVEANDAFRLVFTERDNEPFQEVKNEVDVKNHYTFISVSNIEELRESITTKSKQTFSLPKTPVWDITLYELPDAKYCFYLRFHHLIGDGESLNLFIQKLIFAYNQVQSEPPSHQLNTITYRDYVSWVLDKTNFKNSSLFWKKEFSNYVETFFLPSDKGIDATNDSEGQTAIFELSESKTRSLRQWSIANRVSLASLYTAAVGIVLSKRGNSNDFVLGVPTASRNHPQLTEVIGNLVNTLPLRMVIDYSLDKLTYVQEVQSRYLAVLDHQIYPFEYILEDIDYQRTSNNRPLFNVMVSVSNTKAVQLSDQEIDLTKNTSLYDLTFTFLESENKIQLALEYATSKFEKQTIDDLSHEIDLVFDQLTQVDPLKISSICLCDQNADSPEITYESETKFTNVLESLTGQVAKNDSQKAVVFGDRSLTYREFYNSIRELAKYLQQVKAVRQNSIVAVSLDKSVEQLSSMYAIWMAGGIYVPIDASLPEERKKMILDDCEAEVVVNSRFFETYPNRETSPITSLEFPRITGDSIAYLLYTSGTTGKPKGVMISHDNLANKIQEETELVSISESSVTYTLTNSSFDVSFLETVLPLSNGGKVIIADDAELKDTEKSIASIIKSEVSHLQGTPTYFSHFIRELTDVTSEKLNTSLRYFCIGGESLNAHLVEQIKSKLPAVKINNHYGPTEITIDALVKTDISTFTSNSIGTPFGNTKAYIVDEFGNFLPRGVVGELIVGGPSVFSGYWKDEDLTNKKLISLKTKDGRFYKTGDLAKINSDNEFEFIGRKDKQVKLRGFRIELDDLNQTLLTLDNTNQAISQVVDNVLVSWVVSEAQEEVLKEQLRKLLPEYMVPRSIVIVESFPLTDNGKIAIKKLPVPKDLKREYVAPRTDIESRIVEIWKEVLAVDKVGVYDNFFELGGHSLKLMKLLTHYRNAFQKQIQYAEVYKKSTVSEHAKVIGIEKCTVLESISKVKESESYKVSSAQKRLWILSQQENISVAYNMSGVLQFDGFVDLPLFQKAVNRLINRHESLRTIFALNPKGELVQKIQKSLDNYVRVNEIDFSNEDDECVRKTIETLGSGLFDLQKGPLFSLTLLKFESHHGVHYSLHHIISDGRSNDIIEQEINEIYQSLLENRKAKLPLLDFQYKDFSNWENQQRENGQILGESYWRNLFNSEIPKFNFPSSATRPKIRTFNGSSFTQCFSKKTKSALEGFAEKNQHTIYATILGALHGILARYTGNNDVTIGSPVENRILNGSENQVGLFVNTIVHRNELNSEDSFKTYLNHVDRRLSQSLTYQSYPYDLLVEELDLPLDSSRNPLFDVMLNYQRIESDFDEVEVLPVFTEDRTVKFDLEFHLSHYNNLIVLDLVYNRELYSKELIEQFLEHFKSLLSTLVADPTQNTLKARYISLDEEYELTNSFNETKVLIQENNFNELFEKRVDQTPNKTAVVDKSGSVTYKELDDMSSRFAHFLMAKWDLSTGDVVAIETNKSIHLIAMLLGISKAGLAYLTIDEQYPESRKAFFRENSDAKLVVDSVIIHEFLETHEIYSSKFDSIDLSGDNLFHVMYTSGSTGQPKGVMLHHKNIVNFVKNLDYFPLDEESVLLATVSISFDTTNMEFWGSLYNGAKVVLAGKEDLLDFEGLRDIISTHGINSMWLTAGLFRSVAEYDPTIISNLKQFITGGDIVSPRLVKKLKECNPELKVVNGYGPTESTTFATTFEIDNSDYGKIPIGKPTANTSLYILDEFHQLVPKYVQGELYIEGLGLASGYMNRPELTEESFMQNPYTDKIMYRTGDYGYWSKEGVIHFDGRIDGQIKIRGHRVEPSSIEKIVSDLEGIESAIILCEEKDKEKQLLAYLVSDRAWAHNELIAQLKDQLPVYMIPSRFTIVKSLPITANGKVDRRALLALEPLPSTFNNGRLPESEFEIKLATIWQEVLGVDQVHMDDDFFLLGGHSLGLSKLMNNYHQSFNARISYINLFKSSTLNEHCLLIGNNQGEDYQSIPKAMLEDAYAVSSAQKRIWLLSQFEEYAKAYNVPFEINLGDDLDIDLFKIAIEGLVSRHDALRLRIFLDGEGVLKQRIIEDVVLDSVFTFVDNSENGAVSLDQIRKTVFDSFDFDKDLLVRFCLVKDTVNSFRFIGNIHHTVCDGVSIQLIEDDLLELYFSMVEQRNPNLSPLPIAYVDYAVWQQKSLLENDLKEQGEFWKKTFDTIPEKVNFPSRRKSNVSQNGNNAKFQLDKVLVGKLDAFNKRNSSTRFITLVAIYNAVLYKYTSQSDIVVGTPYSGRNHADLANLVGVFINTLPIRTVFQENDSFIDLFKSVKKNILEVMENADYPFEELVESLNIKKDLDRTPLFDTMIAYQDFAQKGTVDEMALNNDVVRFGTIEDDTSLFDFTLTLIRGNEVINGIIEFKTDVFETSEIEQFITHFKHVLDEVLEHEEQELNGLSLVSKEELELIHSLSVGSRIERSKEPFNIRWLNTINHHQDNVAIKFGNELLTYKELNCKANQVLNYFNEIEEFKQGEVISIDLNRGISAVICMVALLKSGKAYLPIDTKLPINRKAHMLAVSNCNYSIDNSKWKAFQDNCEKISSEEFETENYSIETPAYIIFTSGSTGVPKGVKISQESLLDYVDTFTNYFGVNVNDKVIHQASLSFDTHVEEIYPCLLAGGTVLLTKEGGSNIDELSDLIEEGNATILSVTPLIMNELNKHDFKVNSLRFLISGGDELKASHIDKLFDKYDIYNTYGPSESTVCASYSKVTSLSTVSSIGLPIENREIFILNERHEIVPIGQVGEIYIGGKGLFMEYVNQPEMTREKLVQTNLNDSKVVYKSGDLGRWIDGEIEFLGRKDEQVKIRGYRIELREIELKIAAHPDVNETVVFVDQKEDKEKRLIAFYTSGSPLPYNELRNYLFGELVDYMIPNVFIELQEIPRNINGKIDKDKLNYWLEQEESVEVPFQKAQNEIEEAIVQELSRLFEIEAAAISVLQNFFDLGINSLHFVRFKRFLLSEFKIDVAIVKFFEYPTIRSFSGYCEELINDEGISNEKNDNVPASKEEGITADEIMNLFE